MNFETHLAAERARGAARDLGITQRMVSRFLAREERRKQSKALMYLLYPFTVFLMAAVLLLAVIVPLTLQASGAADAQDLPEAAETAPPAHAPADVPEDYENEKIEAALYASGYFREDVPLDGDTQALLHAACDESGVPYALALAVIAQETGFRNVTGDDGASCGYMQIQEQWHRDRMERLGVTDLADPFGNFRVGCDYLAELMGRYSLEEALTAYNSGCPGKSRYASAVLETMEGYL